MLAENRRLRHVGGLLTLGKDQPFPGQNTELLHRTWHTKNLSAWDGAVERTAKADRKPMRGTEP